MYNKRVSNFSERLLELLTIRRIKQSELCEKTKIPKSAMSQYISGAFEPKQDRLFLIANALNVSEVWLMGYDVPINAETEAVKRLLELIKMLNDNEVKQVSEYIDFLISKRDNK